MSTIGQIGITVAICTRNRVAELTDCLESLAMQQGLKDQCLEILIIDDGNIEPTYLAFWQEKLKSRYRLQYVKKQKPGLFLSRMEAFAAARHDIVLFLDDDVVLEPEYLATLLSVYEQYPDVAGVGGVDQKIGSSALWRAVMRLLLYNSGKPGKLSCTGYGGAMAYWPSQKTAFESEFLSGCNMSFVRSQMMALQPQDWLSSYSLGEDLYLSEWARKQGRLLVCPALRVWHNQSPLSRDSEGRVAETEIANHWWLLQQFAPRPYKKGWSLWTAAGLLVWALVHCEWGKAKGYWRGIRFLWRQFKGIKGE